MKHLSLTNQTSIRQQWFSAAGKLQNTPSGVNLLLVMELMEFSGTGNIWCIIAVLPIMLKL